MGHKYKIAAHFVFGHLSITSFVQRVKCASLLTYPNLRIKFLHELYLNIEKYEFYQST